MHIRENHHVLYLGILLLSIFWAGLAYGQAASQGGSGPNTLGGFVGFTDRFDADFSFGAEFEHRLNSTMSVSGIVEHTPDVVQENDATVVLGTFNLRPLSSPRLKLIGGAGVEFRDYGSDHVRFRAGAGYDLFIDSGWTVTPRVSVDFGEGDENVVLGATASYRF